MKKVKTIILVLLLALPSLALAAFNVTQVQQGTDSGFGISNLIQTPDRVYPGDQVSISMSFFTTKQGGASNVIVTPTLSLLATTKVFTLGDLQKNVPETVSFTFTVPTTTKPGTYPTYVYASDANSPQKQVALFQLAINEPAATGLIMAKVAEATPLKTGKSSTVNLELTNTGALDATDVILQVNTSSSATFTALDTDRKYVEKIEAGKTVTIPVAIGVSASATPGYYPLTTYVTYNIDKKAQTPVQQNLGVRVDASPQLLVTSDQQATDSGITVTLNIANVGDTAVRGVYVKASSQGFRITSASDKFIGTLNLDDSSTMALTLSPRGPAGQQNAQPEQTVEVTVSYKDPVNEEHTVKNVITIQPSAPPGALGTSATGANARFRRPGQASGFLGLDLIQWAGVIVGAIVIGFLAFRWYKRRKK